MNSALLGVLTHMRFQCLGPHEKLGEFPLTRHDLVQIGQKYVIFVIGVTLRIIRPPDHQ